MALLIDANNEHVAIADAASIRNLRVFTSLMWVNLHTTAVASRVWSKNSSVQTDLSRNNTILLVNLLRTVLPLQIIVNWADFAAYALDTWLWLAIQVDENDAANCRVWVGGDGLSDDAAEPSAYTVQDNGSGTFNDDTGLDLLVGNRVSADRPMNADVSHFSLYTRIMDGTEINAQRLRRHADTDCVLFHEYGYNGVNSQPDWSGNGNAGTAANATVSAHVPLPAGAMHRLAGIGGGLVGRPHGMVA